MTHRWCIFTAFLVLLLFGAACSQSITAQKGAIAQSSNHINIAKRETKRDVFLRVLTTGSFEDFLSSDRRFFEVNKHNESEPKQINFVSGSIIKQTLSTGFNYITNVGNDFTCAPGGPHLFVRHPKSKNKLVLFDVKMNFKGEDVILDIKEYSINTNDLERLNLSNEQSLGESAATSLVSRSSFSYGRCRTRQGWDSFNERKQEGNEKFRAARKEAKAKKIAGDVAMGIIQFLLLVPSVFCCMR